MARRPFSVEGHDPSRREFFRTFTRQTVQNAGAVVGAATELQRTSMAAAREILDIPEPARPGTVPLGQVTEQGTPAPATFRSAYRFTGDAIVLLDQRELPAHVTTFETREPNEIAAAIRLGAVTPGPILGELAAYGVALAARAALDRSEGSREQLVRAACGTLRGARREVRALAAAVDRVESRYDVLAASGATSAEIAHGLAAEADEISAAAATAHARIARRAADAFHTDRLRVLIHGDAGPLSCGMVGMTTTCFRTLIDAGSDAHVWVTVATPSEEGSRVAAYQLAQADIPHTVIPDTAVGSLLTTTALDAVILRGDTVAANGDAAALVGALQVAQLAHAADVPVILLAPGSSFDMQRADLSDLLPAGHSPGADVVPAALITRLVTEEAG